jgi:hypothetical protein
MRLRPDRLEMTAGETRKVEIDLGPTAGANTISGTPVWTGNGLTIASEAVSGTVASAFVSGGDANKNYIVTLASDLSSLETVVGAFTVEVKAAGLDARAGR